MNDPRMSQWRQRHNAALSTVKADEAARDPERVRQAYEALRQSQMARPDPGATDPGQSGRTPALRKTQKAPAANQGGIFNYIANAMKGARPKQ